MRLYRPRFRLRRLMVAVAAVAVALRVGPWLLRAPQHWSWCRSLAEHHAEREAACLKPAAQTEDRLRRYDPRKAWPTMPADGQPFFIYTSGIPFSMIADDLAIYRRMAAYHARMRRHWGWVAYQPWRSLRAEARADIAQQEPDFLWQTTDYGLPVEDGSAPPPFGPRPAEQPQLPLPADPPGSLFDLKAERSPE